MSNTKHHETPPYLKQTHVQLWGVLLTNTTHLILMQHQRHDASVETADHKASQFEQIDHCSERPVDQACTGTFVDTHPRNKRYPFLKDGQLKEQ